MNESRTDNPLPTLRPSVVTQIAVHPSPSFDDLPTLHAGDPELLRDGNTAVAPGVDEDLPLIPGYQLLGRLGEGGMGVVYRALHLGLKRPVALKVLRHADHATDVLRLHREAELAARLAHPHIVQVYEVGAFRSAQ